MTVANGDKMKMIGSGSIDLFSKKNTKCVICTDCPTNLLSINKIAQELNCEIIFTTKKVIFQDWNTKSVIGERVFENRLYYLKEETCNFVAKREEEIGTLWHKRIGHPSDKILKCIFYFKTLDCSNCELCKLGKHTKLPFSLSKCKSKKLFKLIHSDVWGPVPVESFNGFKYFVIFIDNFSKTTWLYLLKNKSEVFSQFVNFCKFVENQYDTKINTFRSDNGTEFVNYNFTNFFKEKGILHQTTCVYTPEQNEVSEQKKSTSIRSYTSNLVSK
jgi:Integrase core domain/GAG-pre-integrase domain